MQKTSITISAESLINIAWKTINNAAMKNVSENDAFMIVLTCLYCHHKGYNLQDGINGLSHIGGDDQLLYDLISSFRIDQYSNLLIRDFSRIIVDINPDDFNAVYISTLKSLFERICLSSRQVSEFFTPEAVTRLMAYFVKKNSCHSVYDPFCGTASILHEFAKDKNVIFEGQELNPRISLYARLIAEAVYGSDNCIHTGDSINQWNNKHFDAVVSCPPFAVRLSKEHRDFLTTPGMDYCRTVDDFLLVQSFATNSPELTVSIHPVGFCFQGLNERSLRAYLINHNLVDTIVFLPAKIFYGTSIPTVLIVCKRNRTDSEPVTFVYADDYVLGTGINRSFDVESVLSMLEGDRHNCVSVTRDTIRSFEYSFAPGLYVPLNSDLKDGQRLISLGDMIHPVNKEKIDFPVEKVISMSKLSADFITVLLNKNRICTSANPISTSINHALHPKGKTYLFTSRSMVRCGEYGLYNDDKNIVYSSLLQAYQIDDSVVDPDYLVYKLVNDKAIASGSVALNNYMHKVLVIDSLKKQHEIVAKQKQEYHRHKEAEEKADNERLGVKENISDFEHMLSPVQMRINRIIAKLENISSDSDNLKGLVKSLKDNMSYMERIIQYTNSNLNGENLSMEELDIAQFINNYAEGWKNYGGPYFDLEICDELDGTTMVNADKTKLTVMFDAILNNAARHGFQKNKHHTAHNQVQIQLSLVEYKDQRFVRLAFANNGDQMSDGFTIKDYISKGRYSAASGRSGLGGYHVYSIVKGHNGYLFLDSNKMWNMVVEVLLPVTSTQCKTFNTYEHECL